MNNDKIQSLNLKDLLSSGQYRIPIYQRNYDWGEREALQLLEDIADYASINRNKNYYIGSVIVFERYNGQNNYYETIDGQQRLTTLTILMSVLKSIDELNGRMDWFNHSNLSYDHRDEANEAIRLLGEKGLIIRDSPSTASISEVYKIFEKNLKLILESKGINLSTFVEFLLSHVIILRIPVPQDTELNHYFEIMNSRGEQLEKHEVLKATLMSYLDKESLDKKSYDLYNDIWEACANMNTYVQMNMSPKLRKIIFSENWANLQHANTVSFDTILEKYQHIEGEPCKTPKDEYKEHSLLELFEDAEKNVKYELPKEENNNKNCNDRFGSVINFPNFLLQVLKIMYSQEKNYNEDVDAEIKLDDKRLIEIFQTVLKIYNSDDDKKSFTKRYIIALLKSRYLFDSYVIKRENYNGKEGWSLKCLKKYEDGKANYIGTFHKDDKDDSEDDIISKDIRMLESMFHVSAPTQTYKHWLNAILYYLYDKENVKDYEFRDKLYKLACTYMLDRYLCKKEEKRKFETIIYEKKFEASNNKIHWEMIDNGCHVENFVFNFYDYVTWKKNHDSYKKFEFTYRTSVEHFYPQNPMPGHDNLEGKGLNDFGNLCLISRGMNSKFSNNMPKAKLENFGLIEEVRNGLSLKLLEMMDVINRDGDWGETQIKEFEEKARNRIKDALQQNNLKIRL